MPDVCEAEIAVEIAAPRHPQHGLGYVEPDPSVAFFGETLRGDPRPAANVQQQTRLVFGEHEKLKGSLRHGRLNFDHARVLLILLCLVVIVENLRRCEMLRSCHWGLW
eukprot:Amastigsp_a676523_397.p4 type:complete len:108 gc:universal Amastigsp_a676523_397:724-1047(+)